MLARARAHADHQRRARRRRERDRQRPDRTRRQHLCSGVGDRAALPHRPARARASSFDERRAGDTQARRCLFHRSRGAPDRHPPDQPLGRGRGGAGHGLERLCVERRDRRRVTRGGAGARRAGALHRHGPQRLHRAVRDFERWRNHRDPTAPPRRPSQRARRAGWGVLHGLGTRPGRS